MPSKPKTEESSYWTAPGSALGKRYFKTLHYTKSVLWLKLPEEWAFVKPKENRIIVQMSKVDLAPTHDDRYAGAELLDLRIPMFVNTAEWPRMNDGITDEHNICPVTAAMRK